MSEEPGNALAAALAKHLPDDCQFYLIIAEKKDNDNITMTTMTSVTSQFGQIRLLEEALERAIG